MQFQIPQFIETEDKIVGPFSLKQFLYAGGGIGTSMMLYFILAPWLWFPVAALLVAAGLSLAFVKVNGRSLPVIMFSATHYFWGPKIYVWQAGEHEQFPAHKKEGFSMEGLASGLALSNIWQRVQTGTAASAEKSKMSLGRLKEKYQIFGRLSGERDIAKRVDYR